VKYKLLIVFSFLALATVNVTAAEVLRNNPFEQPEMVEDLRSAKAGTKAAAGMELHGTILDGDDSLANIDGEYYRINQEVSGYRVVRIESGSVIMSRSGDEKILTLHKDE
jgi:hypothetical protein